MKKSLTVALALSAVAAFGLSACKKPAAPADSSAESAAAATSSAMASSSAMAASSAPASK